MKLESDTLYIQWRNLTTCCPERCDPLWIDLRISPVSDPKLLAVIETAQAKPKSRASCGYDWFIADMGELLNQAGQDIIPRIGAGHLSLRYQTPVSLEGDKLFFDYFIVPKLSRASVFYVAPDVDFKVLKKRGRFRLSSFSRNILSFDLEQASYKMSEEGEDYYRMLNEHSEELPMPDSKIVRGRHNAAESEWMDLNLLASYRFTKDSVQLLYMPVDPNLMIPVLTPQDTHVWLDSNTERYLKRGRAKRKRRVYKSKRRYSPTVNITSASVLSGQYLEDLKTLKILEAGKMSAEDFTDKATGRNLVDDSETKAEKDQGLEDTQKEEDYNPYSTFIFSNPFPDTVRSSDPEDETRRTDPNREYLFSLTTDQGFLESWYVSVFDPITEEFLAKTIEEWQTDCIIDDINLLPGQYIPGLLRRGLTADDILYLSAQIGEGAPEAQIEQIVSDFLTKEVELRLR